MKPNSGNDIWHYVAQFHCWKARSVTTLQCLENPDTYYNMNKIFVMLSTTGT